MLFLGCLFPLLLQSQEARPSVRRHAEPFAACPQPSPAFTSGALVILVSVSQVFVALLVPVCLFNECNFTLDVKLFLYFFLFPFFFFFAFLKTGSPSHV